jgi:uncharacterized membrane protein
MESQYTFFGHPIHAMVVVFPLGLLFTSFLFDLLYLWRKDHFWARGAFWMMAVGTAGALAAVVTGLLDYLAIGMPPRARETATLHLLLGLGVVVLYGVQLWLRRSHAAPAREFRRHPWGLLLLAFLSVQAIGVQGWLGGELSHVYGVGVTAERNRPGVLPMEYREPDGAARLVSGPEVYRRVCAGCHGSKGEGQIGPRLTTTEHPHEWAEIVKIVRGGKAPLMPAFETQLSPAEINAVAVYVSSMMRGEHPEGGAATAQPDHSGGMK